MSYDNIPDHPIIHNMESTGHPDGKEPPAPICPICEKECETIYKDLHKDIVGCDNCIKTYDACEIDQCFKENEE